MGKKCFICRKEKSWLLSPAVTFRDVETGENYTICTDCQGKLRKSIGLKNWGLELLKIRDLGLQPTAKMWYDQGLLSMNDLQLIQKDSVEIIAKKHLNTSNPSGYLYINNKYIIYDEPQQCIIINHCIINFADIRDNKIFDNSIEYQIQSPTVTHYDTNTKYGLTRTIVGGMLAGSAGAIMGGLTSKHSLSVTQDLTAQYTTTEHNFTVIINLKTMSYGGSIAVQIGKSEVETQLLLNFLNKIIGA